MPSCWRKSALLLLFCVVSDVLLDKPQGVLVHEDIAVTVEDSTVSPPVTINTPVLEEGSPIKEANETKAIVVNNNEVIMLSDKNVDYVSGHYNFVLILFYVNWCRFSIAMLPTFDQLIVELFKVTSEPRKFAITKIDCDAYESVCDSYGIVKFPTVKVMRHGSIEKLEYRKERNVEALKKYVLEELVDPTILVQAEEEALRVETDKRRIIGYLSKRRPYEEEIFRKAASHFKSLCTFILYLTDSEDRPRIQFQPDIKSPEDESAEMPMDNINYTLTFPYVRDWSNYKCVPYVREITFENAEEITEEGLPLFILFYRQDEDLALMKTFKRVITKHFVDDIIGRKINFVTANGALFIHPLAHLGKTASDLPLIAIDSLKHMFSYPYKSKEDLVNLEKLKRYLADFYSERLHFKYHGLSFNENDDADDHDDDDDELKSTMIPINRPDQIPPGPARTEDGNPQDEEDGDKIVKESDFIRLYPSDRRYTLKRRPIRDEL